jgi:hypothetical protein
MESASPVGSGPPKLQGRGGRVHIQAYYLLLCDDVDSLGTREGGREGGKEGEREEGREGGPSEREEAVLASL